MANFTLISTDMALMANIDDGYSCALASNGT